MTNRSRMRAVSRFSEIGRGNRTTMISWGPSVRPLHETAEYGGHPSPQDRGFLITLDGIVPLEPGEQAPDAFDLGAEQDRLEH